jgi:hypothetical protein
MKAAFSHWVGLVLVFTVAPALSLAQYGGGKGTAEEPYLIITAAHLATLAGDSSNWSKHFKLMADLDFSGMSLKPIPAYWYESFTGVFDGNRHVLSHITMSLSKYDDAGLFATIGRSGVVRNLGLIDVALQGDAVGALAGVNAGTITGCFATGQCKGRYNAGGLVGENSGQISRCFAAVQVSGEYSVGGMVGGQNSGTTVECYAIGAVSGPAGETGGLIGDRWSSGASRCFWDTQTTGQTASGGGQGKTTAQM